MRSFTHVSNLHHVTHPPFISVSQAATDNGVPKRTIQYAIAKGELRAVKLPGLTGAYLIDPADLQRWLAARSTEAAS